MIGIINYKMGNLQSLVNSLDYLNIPNRVIDSPDNIINCDKLILPGVGAFGLAMQQLNSLGFIKPINDYIETEKPILGICLGMQLLLKTSEEHGNHRGLGLIDGHVLSFRNKIKDLPVPHVGWNNIHKKNNSIIFNNIEDNEDFYFVHSFYCDLSNNDEIIAETDYGFSFTSAFEKRNIFGCQFHPEKSQRAGLAILENFNNII